MKRVPITSRLYGDQSVWKRSWITGLVCFVMGALIGVTASRLVPQKNVLTAYSVREKGDTKYGFIDPLLTFETPESNTTGSLVTLKSTIEK